MHRERLAILGKYLRMSPLVLSLLHHSRVLLDLEELYDFTGEDGRMRYICLVESKSQLVLCLAGH